MAHISCLSDAAVVFPCSPHRFARTCDSSLDAHGELRSSSTTESGTSSSGFMKAHSTDSQMGTACLNRSVILVGQWSRSPEVQEMHKRGTIGYDAPPNWAALFAVRLDVK